MIRIVSSQTDESIASQPLGKKCEDIGSIVVGLYYLSSEAKKSGLGELSNLIEKTISSVVSMGGDIYSYHVIRDLQEKKLVRERFIDHFCPTKDHKIQLDLKEIALRQNTETQEACCD